MDCAVRVLRGAGRQGCRGSRRGCCFHCRLRVARSETKGAPEGLSVREASIGPFVGTENGGRGRSRRCLVAPSTHEKRGPRCSPTSTCCLRRCSPPPTIAFRERGNAKRSVTDAEGVALAVAQAKMDIAPDREFLAVARGRLGHVFPKRGAADSPAPGPLLLTCAGIPRQAQGPGLSGLNCGGLATRVCGWWCGWCARGRPALLRSTTRVGSGPAT